ncbi:MAG: precorrin-6A reductase [Oscillospiraceae bacterium]|jgi:precorrin-2 dehydrogenase/sirohydrochlorin ferrochelatase/precorrin-6A/cobalt-precorrin-6A reductase|nr:precorrin-6A reductase [Oscillospiraceae bacterium]
MKLAVFSGTSDGRRLCEHLSARGVTATVCVATGYGGAVMPLLDGITVREGRLDRDAMAAFLRDYDTVADATHPYAALVSDNLREVCGELGLRYLRLVRPTDSAGEAVLRVGTTREAAELLNAHGGNALITTGSKELHEFTAVRDYETRLYARILPDADGVRRANELGFSGKRLICMQGPFSREMNAATLRAANAEFLVTKNTGGAGGLPEKLAAATDTGARVILISRPRVETGYTLAELAQLLTGAEIAVDTPKDAPRFPLFVSLLGKSCVIVGGGTVACRRAAVLREYSAAVTVIAPTIREKLDGVRYIEREYRAGDLGGAELVVAATDSRAVNAEVTRAAREFGIPLSVSDASEDCTFWFPASCVGATVSAGVVSRDGNHKLAAEAARRIREVLADI